jgi:hypothetical protein
MNKAESMGYGPARGANPAGEPLPKSNEGSFKNSSEAATLVAVANTTTAEQLNDQTAANLAIEARKVTPEVARLNDTAEIAIYGTRGQTAGYVDAAGKPISKPILGTIDQILTSPRYGNTPAERKKAEAAAKVYSDGVDKLLGEGFELCQAKLVMDKRSEWAYNNDQSAKSEVKEGNKYFRELDRRIDLITEQNIKNGDAPDIARQKAEDRVRGHNVEMGKPSVPEIDAKAEESRVKGLIKKHGVFTTDELEAVLAGKTPDVPLTPAQIAAKEQAERTRVSFTQQVEAARSAYARASAARGRRAFHRNKQQSQESVQSLRSAYEAASATLIAHELHMAQEAGVSTEDLTNYSGYFAAGEAERMANTLQRERQLATEKYELATGGAGISDFDDRGNRRTQEIEASTKAGKLLNKFYKWWGKQGADSKFLSAATLKKSAVLGGAGIVVGIPAALAGSFIFGPIAGGALGAVVAGRIAKSVMAYNVNKRGQDPLYVERLTSEVEGSAARLEHLTDIGDVIDSQTKNEVKRNRRRLGGAVVAAAVGGAVGSIGAEHLFGFGDNNNGGGGHNTTGHGSGTTGTSGEQGATGTAGSTGATGANGPNPGGPSADTHGGSSPPPDSGEQTSSAVSKSLELKSGDNPWDVSAKFLEDNGYKHDVVSIDKAKDAVLAHYNLSEADATHLPVGWKFQIPPDVLAEIGKE